MDSSGRKRKVGCLECVETTGLPRIRRKEEIALCHLHTHNRHMRRARSVSSRSDGEGRDEGTLFLAAIQLGVDVSLTYYTPFVQGGGGSYSYREPRSVAFCQGYITRYAADRPSL